MRDILRRVRFQPYRKGHGPTFALTLWATPRTDSRGQTILGYRLTQSGPERAWEIPHKAGRATLRRVTLFSGEDFAGSPLHADDSDATVAAIMGFLTLRPGDTDADYFTDYTDAQRAYCAEHAEALASEVYSRFGEN